jgi:hypothetical protein
MQGAKGVRDAAARARGYFTHQTDGREQDGAGAESTDDDNAAYFEHEGGIWHRKLTPKGEGCVERLTNFTARIEQQRAIDDGAEVRCYYRVAVTVRGRRVEVKVPAAEFGSMSWVSEHLPADVGVLPGLGAARPTKRSGRFAGFRESRRESPHTRTAGCAKSARTMSICTPAAP